MIDSKSLDLVINELEKYLEEYGDLSVLVTEGSQPNGIAPCTHVLIMELKKDDVPDYSEKYVLCGGFCGENKELLDPLMISEVLYQLKLSRETLPGETPVFVTELTNNKLQMPCKYTAVINASVPETDDEAPDDIRGQSYDFVLLANFGEEDMKRMTGGE